MKNLEDYKDIFGFITTLPGHDGGDTCANEATVFYASNGKEGSFKRFLTVTADNFPVRYPYIKGASDPRKWYTWICTFSRDQLIGLIIALCSSGEKPRLIELFRFHKRRWLLSTWNTKKNYQYPTEPEFLSAQRQGHIGRELSWDGYKNKMPDITGPEIWALWIRALRSKWFYPLLWILDLETFIGTIFKNLSSSNIHRNHILILHFSKNNWPTFWIKWAIMIYDKDNAIKRGRAHYASETYPPIDVYLTKLVREL